VSVLTLIVSLKELMARYCNYANHVMKAEYDDTETVSSCRDAVEAEWPDYAKDHDLSQIRASERLLEEGKPEVYMERHNKRMDNLKLHYQNHLHPKDSETGERRVPRSCQNKTSGPDKCKSFAPHKEYPRCTTQCSAMALEGGQPEAGAKRSRVGTLIPASNDQWLTGAHEAHEG
jgi:hypothetical protein